MLISNTVISDTVFLFITTKCNLSCSHCYVSATHHDGVEMDITVIQQTLQLFSTLGICDFRITGGEPTIHSIFNEIIYLFFENGYKVGLTTNGIKIFHKENMISILEKLSRCWVSIYGLTAYRNRLISGIPESRYKWLLTKVGEISRCGYPTGISAILVPGDQDLISDFIEYIYSIGIKRLRFISVEPDGRAEINLDINWENWLYEVHSIYRIINDHILSHKFEFISINDPFDLSNRYKNPNDSCLIRNRRMWSILPDGEIYPCCFNVPPLSTPSITNIFEKNAAQKLLSYSDNLSNKINCRGLSPSYWKLKNQRPITCPISALTI